MMKMISKLVILSSLLMVISCGTATDMEAGANIEYSTYKDTTIIPLDEQQSYEIDMIEYPDEGTMFEIKGEKGNSINLFIAVLPTELEAKTYKLEIDESNKSNLSYTLKVAGKTGYCCNTNSSGLLTITEVAISKDPKGITGAVAAQFELEDGRFAKVKGSFIAVK